MSDEPDPPGGDEEQRELLARQRAVVEAEDAVLRAELAVERELRTRLELQVAELQRRLGMDSTDSGTPTSREPIGARERRKAGRRSRQESERERRKDRRRGGQPGHLGSGLARDPDPDERKDAEPPAQCSRCGAALDGARAAGSSWAQVWDVSISRLVTEWLLPALRCPCCGQVTVAAAPAGAHPGSVSYGPGVNTAAVLLAAYGNVPAERSANLIRMMFGIPVSPGFVDKANARLSDRLDEAGFDEAMQAVLAAEPALGADETPVSVLTPEADPHGRAGDRLPARAGDPPPGREATWLRALGSRRAEAITAILGFFTGFLITDGYTPYQQMLPKLAGIQQCAAHVIRRCRAVTKLGPGSPQSWAADVIEILREAHRLVEEARARDGPVDAELLAKLRQRYDAAAAFGITHNRLRDWHDGNHPGYALGCWLRDYAGQVWLFTREPAVEWTKHLRARRQGCQAAPGRLRLLAHPGDPRQMVPYPLLPGLRCRLRPDRPGSPHRRSRRQALAAAAGSPHHGLKTHWRTLEVEVARSSPGLCAVPVGGGVVLHGRTINHMARPWTRRERVRAANSLMRNAFVEIRFLARRPETATHPGGVLAQIAMIADACHNLPGADGIRSRPASAPDPFVYLWQTAGPEQRRWLDSQLRSLGLNHGYLADAPWPPAARPPSRRPRLGRGGIRFPRTLREFVALDTARFRALVQEGAALEPPGRTAPEDMLAHLDRAGRHLARASRPGEVLFLPPGPGDLRQYRCLLQMMDGAVVVGHVRLRASSFAALQPDISVAERLLLAASVPHHGERDVYLWTRGHRAADPQCPLCVAEGGPARQPKPDDT